MNPKTTLNLLATVTLLLCSSCGVSEEQKSIETNPNPGNPAPNNPPISTPTPGGPSISTNVGTVAGRIADTTGRALANVRVLFGSGASPRSAVTNEQGFFALQDVSPGDQALNYRLEGFVDNTKVVPVTANRNSMVSITMRSVGTTRTIDATRPATITHQGGRVKLPANSIVDASGRTVRSAVVQLTTLKPDDPEFAYTMPGEFAGVDDGRRTRLISFGVLDVVLRDSDGKELQLASGQTAELEYPLLGQGPGDPDMPLWYLDTSTGIWIREGTARLDAAAGVYRGTVSHFTPWNLDKGPPTGWKVVCLKHHGRPVPGVTVRAIGEGWSAGGSWMAGGVTGADGCVRLPITASVVSQPSTATIVMLKSDGGRHVLRSQETMPGIGLTKYNYYDETHGVVPQAATILMSWGERPSDLDAHLTVPTPGARSHVWWMNPGGSLGAPYAALDTDDVTSFGPEIITVTKALPGTYRYCLKNFSGNRVHPITESGAKVTLILPGQNVRIYSVPPGNPNSEDYWAVFDLVFDAAGTASVRDVNQFGNADLLKL